MTTKSSRSFVGVVIWELLVPAIVGTLTGACVAVITRAIEGRALVELANLPGFLPAVFSPFALILTVFVQKYITRAEKPSTSELFIQTYHQPNGRIPLWQLPGRLLGAATTVALGGSMGFESASALLGTGWSDALTRWSGRLSSEDDRRSCLAAGASAGIAAVFSSPAVGAFYGIEVPYRRDVDAPRLVPCAIAAVCSFLMRDWLIGSKTLVTVEKAPQIDGLF